MKVLTKGMETCELQLELSMRKESKSKEMNRELMRGRRRRRRPKTNGKMVVVVNGAVVVNDALKSAEVVDGAGDGDGTRVLVVEAILVLGVLQELKEERMVDINERDDEALLLLADENGETALGSVHLVGVPEVRQMNVEIEMEEVLMMMMLVAAEHHRFRVWC